MGSELLTPQQLEDTTGSSATKNSSESSIHPLHSNLEHDTHLYGLVRLLSLKFRDGPKFVEAARRMYAHIALDGNEAHTVPISNETVLDFLEKANDDFRHRNHKQGVDYFVETIVEPDINNRYRIYSTSGPDYLGPHIDYDAQSFPDPKTIFSEYEDPATIFGTELVLTLKAKEAQRVALGQQKIEQIDHHIIQLAPGMPITVGT